MGVSVNTGMPISESDLQTLTDYVVSLESQITFLAKERAFYNEGPAALGKVASLAVTAIPEGYGIGNAGQMIAVSTAAAQAEIERQWPIPAELRKPKRRSKKPDGDGA